MEFLGPWADLVPHRRLSQDAFKMNFAMCRNVPNTLIYNYSSSGQLNFKLLWLQIHRGHTFPMCSYANPVVALWPYASQFVKTQWAFTLEFRVVWHKKKKKKIKSCSQQMEIHWVKIQKCIQKGHTWSYPPGLLRDSTLQHLPTEVITDCN